VAGKFKKMNILTLENILVEDNGKIKNKILVKGGSIKYQIKLSSHFSSKLLLKFIQSDISNNTTFSYNLIFHLFVIQRV